MKVLIASVFTIPEHHGTVTTWRSEQKKVRVDRVRCHGRSYMARLSHQAEDAPHQITEKTEYWVNFRKIDNPKHGIPVMMPGDVLDV